VLSLLDFAGRDPSWWYVIFMDRENPRWWNTLLKPGYQHVQLWRPVQYGPALDEKFWLVVDPGLEHVDTKIDWSPQPPWEREAGITAMRIDVAVRAKKVRDYFFFGPVTCVELAKAHLGIRSAWIRTPWQLAKYLRARRHTLVLR
jgi:hypothetical protein